VCHDCGAFSTALHCIVVQGNARVLIFCLKRVSHPPKVDLSIMAASPRSDLDDFVNVSSPPGPSSPPKKAVPFSGGDRTTNLAVYEPDSTHVPKFKQAWNYRVMRAGGIDDYDLELQVDFIPKLTI
jgi:hypothetical protein